MYNQQSFLALMWQFLVIGPASNHKRKPKYGILYAPNPIDPVELVEQLGLSASIPARHAAWKLGAFLTRAVHDHVLFGRPKVSFRRPADHGMWITRRSAGVTAAFAFVVELFQNESPPLPASYIYPIGLPGRSAADRGLGMATGMYVSCRAKASQPLLDRKAAVFETSLRPRVPRSPQYAVELNKWGDKREVPWIKATLQSPEETGFS